MSFYDRHLFFCNNIRMDGEPCCGRLGAQQLYRHAKNRCRNENKLGQGKIGVSESRCLGRCTFGPVAVVYPDDVWYQYIDETDIDDIIDQHLIGGKPVKRLQID